MLPTYYNLRDQHHVRLKHHGITLAVLTGRTEQAAIERAKRLAAALMLGADARIEVA